MAFPKFYDRSHQNSWLCLFQYLYGPSKAILGKEIMKFWKFSFPRPSHGINPILTGGGPFGPEQPKTVWHFHSFMTGVAKIHDFVCFNICFAPVKLVWGKKLWNYKKLKKTILPFRHQRVPPLEKKSKKYFFLFLFWKIILFLLESEFYMFLAFFWGI